MSTIGESLIAERRNDMDGLRVVALGCVVLYHVRLHIEPVFANVIDTLKRHVR